MNWVLQKLSWIFLLYIVLTNKHWIMPSLWSFDTMYCTISSQQVLCSCYFCLIINHSCGTWFCIIIAYFIFFTAFTDSKLANTVLRYVMLTIICRYVHIVFFIFIAFDIFDCCTTDVYLYLLGFQIVLFFIQTIPGALPFLFFYNLRQLMAVRMITACIIAETTFNGLLMIKIIHHVPFTTVPIEHLVYLLAVSFFQHLSVQLASLTKFPCGSWEVCRFYFPLCDEVGSPLST